MRGVYLVGWLEFSGIKGSKSAVQICAEEGSSQGEGAMQQRLLRLHLSQTSDRRRNQNSAISHSDHHGSVYVWRT